MALYIESLYSYIQDISTIISTYVGTLEKTKEDIVEDSSVSSVVECRARFYANIQNTLKDIYKALNLSAVSGEYVNKIDFETILEDISTNVGEIITLLPDQVAEEESKTLMNTVNCIRRDLSLYKFQVHLFWKSVNNPRAKFVDYDIINDDNSEIKDNNIQDILEGKELSNGLVVFINGGQENDIIMEKITNATGLTSWKWIKGLNACNIYYII